MASDGGGDSIVDACYAELGEDAPAVQLMRCVVNDHAAEMNREYWQFARNILLVFSVGVCPC